MNSVNTRERRERLRELLLNWGEETCNYDRKIKKFEKEISKIVKGLPDSDAKSAIAACEIFIRKAETRLNRRLHQLDDSLADKEQKVLFARKRKVSNLL